MPASLSEGYLKKEAWEWAVKSSTLKSLVSREPDIRPFPYPKHLDLMLKTRLEKKKTIRDHNSLGWYSLLPTDAQ